MSVALQIPEAMTVAEFLVWDAPDEARWQLVDGQPVAMAPASPVHGAIQNELGALLRNHLLAQGNGCRVVATPGVALGKRSDVNFRIPDLGVTCSPLVRDEAMMPDPVLLIEILSPSNPAETWMNVWAYTTIPSVQEVVVIRSTSVEAQVLRRGADGAWPELPASVEDDALVLSSVGFRAALSALYVGTWLAG